MNIYIGIDPGKSGGIAYIDDRGAYTFPYSDEALIQIAEKARGRGAILKVDDTRKTVELPTVRCCLEKVGAFPGEGVVASFSFGKSAGFIEGVLQATGIPYQLITPQIWKREFSLLKKDKKESVKVCRKLFPGVNLLATPRCKKEHDGMAEALLMAEYARRKL